MREIKCTIEPNGLINITTKEVELLLKSLENKKNKDKSVISPLKTKEQIYNDFIRKLEFYKKLNIQVFDHITFVTIIKEFVLESSRPFNHSWIKEKLINDSESINETKDEESIKSKKNIKKNKEQEKNNE